MDSKQIRHDFINNSLRLEVINQIIGEALSQNKSIERKQFDDLEKFTLEQVQLIEKVKAIVNFDSPE